MMCRWWTRGSSSAIAEHWDGMGSTPAMWRIAGRGGIEQPDGGFLYQRTYTPDAKQNYKVSKSKAESSRPTVETTGIGEGTRSPQEDVHAARRLNRCSRKICGR
jgi:hypothetical protein